MREKVLFRFVTLFLVAYLAIHSWHFINLPESVFAVPTQDARCEIYLPMAEKHFSRGDIKTTQKIYEWVFMHASNRMAETLRRIIF